MKPYQDEHDWVVAFVDDSTWLTEGDVQWHIADSGEIAVKGNGALIIPTALVDYSAIRFDAKIDGGGQGTIEMGGGVFWIDVAVAGSRKTGGVTGSPVNANLVDSGEWCAIEVGQHETTTVLLNGIPIISGQTTPSMQGGAVRIVVSGDASVHIRNMKLR